MSGRFGKIAEGIINPGRLMRHVSLGYDGFARYFAADEKPDIDWESDDPFADFLPTEDEAPFVESKHPRDKSGKFAMTAGGGTSGKKKAAKGSKKSIVGELLSKGATVKEILAATGWKAISMPAAAKSLGVEFQKYKENGVFKYKSVPKSETSTKMPDKTPLSELSNLLHTNAIEGIQSVFGPQLHEIKTLEDVVNAKKYNGDFNNNMSWYNLSDEDALTLVKEAQQQEKPAAPAKQKTLKLSDMIKTAPQIGSNPGGVYEDDNGQKYYVKLTDQAHSQNEILAGKLYGLTGAGTKEYIPLEDGEGIASPWVKVTKNNAKNFTPEERKEAQLDFATHAWLANWDAAGLSDDNQVIVNGKPMTIDVGGALEYRAQGEPKGTAFGDEASEWDTLRDPKVNKENAKLFGDMTPEQLKESVDRVAKVTDDQIWEAVNAMAGKDNNYKIGLAAKLEKRRNDLVNRANKEFKAKGGKPAMSPPPPKPSRPPKPVENPIGHLNFVKAGEPDAKGNQVYEKGDNKVKMTPFEEWLSISPGHGTKQGKGKEELKALLEKGIIGPSVKSAKGASFEHWPETAPAKPAALPPPPEQFTSQSTSSSPAAHAKMSELVASAPKPTANQKSAVSAYTGSGYGHINSSLRKGGSLQGDALHVQEYLTKAEIPEDLTVYRKVSGEYASFLKSIMFEGAAFQDKGFSSTALTSDIWHGDVHFKIQVKKGSKGAAVQHISSHKSEMEILLPAGAKYKVTAIKGHEIELEYTGI